MRSQAARTSSGLAELLVAALQQPPAAVLQPGWSAIPAETLAAAAAEHRIAPAVHLHVRNAADVPDSWRAPLEWFYNDQLIRHLRTEADLSWLAGVLNGVGADWVTIKGPVLSDRLWPRPDMRQYLDLDALVDRRAFGAVLEALTSAGASLVDRNWPLVARQMRAELTVRLPHGTSLDLHWDLVNDSTTRHQLSVPTADMVRRRVQAQVGELTVPTFDPADTLLHLALHTAHAGANRLLWIKDVHCAATADGLDWAEVAERARQAGLELTMSIVLRRTSRVLDPAMLPAPPAWRPRRGLWPAAADVAARLFPPPHTSGHGHTGQLLFRSVRRSSGRSALVAARSTLHPDSAIVDGPGNPLHVDRPDDRARTRYLYTVESGARP